MNKKNDFIKRFNDTKSLYLFIIPGIIYYVVFKYYPIYGSQIAFRDFSPFLGFWKSPWVGLENFRRFVSSPMFYTLIRNTLSINLLNLAIGFPFPILLAVLLNQLTSKRFKRVIQTITYAPHFVSTVVLIGIMYTMLSPYSGVINIVIKSMGMEPIFFMAEKKMYVWVYVLSGIWQNCGWSAVIYIAALSAVSPELHEAAIVDGANRVDRILYVDLPCIIPTIMTMLILSAGQLLSIGFDKSYLMQNSINLDVSEVIATYTYKRGLIDGDFSFAAAIEFFQASINFVILILVNKLSKKMSEVSLW